MNPIKMSLLDNDYVVQAKTDFGTEGFQNLELIKFFRRIKENW